MSTHGADADGRALIDELIAHATQRHFVYTQRWRIHDLMMWDDHCTMHHGTDLDDLRWTRDMHRATVSDIGEHLRTGRRRGHRVAGATYRACE